MSYFPEFACTTNPTEALAQELAQNISGILSVIGSAMIVTDIIRKLIRGAQTDPYQRINILRLTMCCIASLTLFWEQ